VLTMKLVNSDTEILVYVSQSCGSPLRFTRAFFLSLIDSLATVRSK
jgi:hypothetical protein